MYMCLGVYILMKLARVVALLLSNNFIIDLALAAESVGRKESVQLINVENFYSRVYHFVHCFASITSNCMSF